MCCVLASCLCQDVPVYEFQEKWNRLSHEGIQIFNDCIEHDNDSKMLVYIKVLYIAFSFLLTTELEHFILDKLTNQADHTSDVR